MVSFAHPEWDRNDAHPGQSIEMGILFDVYLEGDVPELLQCSITEIVHVARGRLRSTNEMTQCGQMRQTYDAASPNCLNATTVPQPDKPFQVSYQVFAEFI